MNSSGFYEETISPIFVWSPTQIARFVLLIAAACVAIPANCMVIAVIAKYRALRSWQNCLLLSLAAADLLLGLVSVPTHLIGDMNVFGQNELGCIALNIPTVILPTASLFSLIAASVERLLGIMYPLRYPIWVSRKRILITVLCIWTYALGLGLLPLEWNNLDDRLRVNTTLKDCNFAASMSGEYTGVFIAGNIFPGMIILLCLNAKLFWVVRRQRKRSAARPNQRHASSATLNGSSDPLPSFTPNNLPRSRRMVFVLLVICHMTILSYIPVCVAFVIDYQWFTVTVITDWKVPYALYAVGSFLGELNAITNPIVLGFANREIRKHLKMMCCKKSPKPVRSSSIALISKIV